MSPDAVPPGEILKKYSRDLTEIAKEGKLDPVIGREEEIRRTIQVLSRRTKNNPVLIGEPGIFNKLKFNFKYILKKSTQRLMNRL